MTRFPMRSGAIAACALAVFGLAACGGSSHKTTSSVKGAHPVAGVASPKGAVPAKQAGLVKLVTVKTGLSPNISGLDNAPIMKAVITVSLDLNHFWSQEFASSGVQWPKTEQVLLSSQAQPLTTPCGRTLAPTDPYDVCFSPTMTTFFWTLPWMQQNVDTDPGGVNLLLGMASLYSWEVQGLFGYFQQVQSGQITPAQAQEQNFCLAGIYAKSINDRRLFESADIPTINHWLATISGGGGSGSATHQQLAGAFIAGLKSGAPATCGISGSTTTTSTTSTAPTVT